MAIRHGCDSDAMIIRYLLKLRTWVTNLCVSKWDMVDICSHTARTDALACVTGGNLIILSQGRLACRVYSSALLARDLVGGL